MFVSGDDIRRLRIGLASPEEMHAWSKGEVTESETINYRTHRPERGGLFAEEIFGPENDYECGCGKYRGRKYEGIKCEKCGVLVTDKSARRVNMGHIDLASPVIHFWYLKGVSSSLSTLLGLKRVTLKRIAYYETEPRQEEIFVVTHSPEGDPEVGEYLTKTQLNILQQKKDFKAEPAYVVDATQPVTAAEGGTVEIVPMKLENEEEITVIRVDKKDYPVSVRAEVLVESGQQIEAGETLAESPFGPLDEVVSEFKLSAFRTFYPEIHGARAVDNVDNLIFLVTQATGEEFPLEVGDLLLEDEKFAYERVYRGQFEAHTGAVGIQGVLANLDLHQVARGLKRQVRRETSEGKRKRMLKRLEIVEHLRHSGNRARDMILEVIPVMPPNLRPIVQLEGGKFATTDLNDLYRRIINRNNRLKKLKEMGAPEVILRNERRMLQEAVDALIYNEKKENPILGRDNRPLKSLSERISGKQGRLRRNLLGKRVDYSGRAVIVVNPKLKLHQCGLPKKMALELFRPFIHHHLQLLEKPITITNYDELKNKALSGELPEVWDILEKLIKDHPVMLNRAPTLHRLGIQAFEPTLVDGEAIQIHPFVCPPYNADFDGDTMSVHVPLYPASIKEARERMLSSQNILSPASGEPLSMPTQDFIFAAYYLTFVPKEGQARHKADDALFAFADETEATWAYEAGRIRLQTPIRIRVEGKLRETTLGRVIFNGIVPEDLRDYDKTYNAGEIDQLVMTCYHQHGNERVVELLEDIKRLGLKYAIRSGLTVSVRDCIIPPEKPEILKEARERVDRINGMFEMGLSTDSERKEEVIKIWRETVDRVEDATMENFGKQRYNPIYGIVESGARGSSNQIKQLAGMRGPMADPSGQILEMPVISNFREGLTTMEYFISTHGGRKGTADTALKTADSGYLTRRLVDACEELVIKDDDCGTNNGIALDPLYYSKTQLMENLETRLYGRLLAADVRFDGEVAFERDTLMDRQKAKQLGELQRELKVSAKDFKERALGNKSVADVRDPEGKQVIVARDESITPYFVQQLKKHKVKTITVRPEVIVRSVLTCETPRGVCQKCYGLDLSRHRLVELGTAVGIISAQSIGEPGTQLTMRTFHTGGIAGEDITQGLPRAEELFEARKALRSTQGEIAPISGHVAELTTTPDGREQIHLESERHTLQLPRELCQVQPGDQVGINQFITGKSPAAGKLETIQWDGARHALIMGEGDAVLHLPLGAEPAVDNGAEVKEGDALTDPYEQAPIAALGAGTVEQVMAQEEEGQRTVIVADSEGQIARYLVPAEVELLVGEGDEVEEGTLFFSPFEVEPLTAPRAGRVFVQGQRFVLCEADGLEGRLISLSDGVSLTKEPGDAVKRGELLFTVSAGEEGGTAVVDAVESLDDERLVDVTYHLEASVALSNTPVVRQGDKVRQGDLVSKGVVSPHTLVKEAGVRATRDYLLTEIHKVYKSQGVDINDKHIELVIRQMLNNVSIEDAGDSPFTPNEIVSLEEFQSAIRRMNEENRQIRLQREELLGAVLAADLADPDGQPLAAQGQQVDAQLLDAWLEAEVEEITVERVSGPETVRIAEKLLPVGERLLMRISKAALENKSWLSAASFQRTTMVLDQAALRGANDTMESLKANVIVSRLVPAGTGYFAHGRNAEQAKANGEAEDAPEAEEVAATAD